MGDAEDTEGTEGTEGMEGTEGTEGMEDMEGMKTVKDTENTEDMKDMKDMKGTDVTEGIKAGSPMSYFAEISAIPRASGSEKAIADYLSRFAEEHGLFYLRDEHNNVFIRKNPVLGCDREPLMLQAHTDMVCEKLPESELDPAKDGVRLVFENGYVFADGTTLGADDGAGCAVMLALLASDDIPHPELECLFTASEETGMDGAFGFDMSVVHSGAIINLDSEREGEACIGCAGGMRMDVRIPTETVAFSGVSYRISVSGLRGGHSGTEIDRGRTSAPQILSAVLSEFYDIYPLHLVSLSGGGRDNVIPFSAECRVAFFGKEEAVAAKEKLSAMRKKIAATLCPEDRCGFTLRMEKCAPEAGMLSLKSTSAVISFLTLAPQGVAFRNPESGEVASSVNMGSVSAGDGGLNAGFLIRSGGTYGRDRIADRVKRLAHVLGGKAEEVSSYPGWEYGSGGHLRSAYERACVEVLGKKPTFVTIHAGLECGLLAGKLEERGIEPDIISIGPDIYDIHTPKERMDISSFERFYDTVAYICRNI